jgi:hypothetical protein
MFLYEWISFRHRHDTPVANSMQVTLHDGRRVIPPGAFLNELKAKGLVTCHLQMTYDTSTTLVFSNPEQVCV